jgi:hypothetical protein
MLIPVLEFDKSFHDTLRERKDCLLLALQHSLITLLAVMSLDIFVSFVNVSECIFTLSFYDVHRRICLLNDIYFKLF